jgi:DNA-binding HxlR family transcriptional regulator
MSMRTYGQYCPIAAALDVLGDRWNLLILRELSFGPQRFTDLRDALPGVAANLLADRLRDLEQAGIVAKDELPPPAARTVYVLTDEGRDVRPVLMSLARFGARRLPDADNDRRVSPRAALATAITAFHDPLAVVEVDDHYRLVIDAQQFDLRTDHGRLRRPATGSEPVVTVTSTARDLIMLRRGSSFDELVASGAIAVTGPKRAQRRFLQTFGLVTTPPRAPAR